MFCLGKQSQQEANQIHSCTVSTKLKINEICYITGETQPRFLNLWLDDNAKCKINEI